MQADFFWSL